MAWLVRCEQESWSDKIIRHGINGLMLERIRKRSVKFSYNRATIFGDKRKKETSLVLQSVACSDPANNGISERGNHKFLASYLVMLQNMGLISLRL